MSYGYSSGNFASNSSGGYLQYPKQVYSTDLQVPITYQLDPPLYSGYQETFAEPTSFQRSAVVSRPHQTSYYRQKISTLGNTNQTTFSGSVGVGSRGFQSFGYASPSPGFGSTGFQSVGYGSRTFSSLNSGSNFYRPTYFSATGFQSTSCQPTYRSGFY